MAFLKLGVISFGGPIAHLGYFRREFVVRRRWLSEAAYAELLGLCQFLPGPTSSQVGFALGMMRAGLKGAVLASLCFTLPSALLMLAFGYAGSRLGGPEAAHILHGLKLVAVAVVAQAVWGMARTLTPDVRRAVIAVTAFVILILASSALAQLGVIVLGALAGLGLCRNLAGQGSHGFDLPVSRRAGIVCLVLFAGLLIILPLANAGPERGGIALFDAFYRSGALVFGGGHVVLPLLRAELVPTGWIGDDAFLAGYGAAQAMPGPLFTFAAYLGAASAHAPNGVAGALVALSGIFLPGYLILCAAVSMWRFVRNSAAARAIVAGTNAAVVGLLAAALNDPLWKTGITGFADMVIVGVGFIMLLTGRVPVLLVVAGITSASMVAGLPA